MLLRPIASLPRLLSLVVLVAGLVATGCTSPEDEAVLAEKELLQKAKKTLQGVVAKTDAALKKGGFESQTLFYRAQLKMLSDAARAVTKETLQAAAGEDAKVTVAPQELGERVFTIELPRAKLADAAKRLSKDAGVLWVQQLKLTPQIATLELVTWPGTLASVANARSGGVPEFKDIKLYVDLKPYRVSADHSPKPTNKALFDETKSLFAELETKQNKLLMQGHSQGVQVLSRSHATFDQGLARLVVFAFDIITVEATPALFTEGTFVPGPTEVRVTAKLGDGITIQEVRKRARSIKRSARGDAAPAGQQSELSWESTGKLAVTPAPKDFKLPEGFVFDAKTKVPKAASPSSQPAALGK